MRDPGHLSDGTAYKYISVGEAYGMIEDLQSEIHRVTNPDRGCSCHQGKKCARCMRREGLL